jgi:hypothetical protein
MTTLLAVKEFLENVQATDPNFEFVNAFNNPHSWRGEYSEIAFQSAYLLTSADMLECVDRAITEKFYGWKGGEYNYCLDKHCHIEAGGPGCYTETALRDFAERLEAMKEEWAEYIASGVVVTEDAPKKPKKRKTKAEKQAEIEQFRKEEKEKQLAEFKANYQTKLLQLLAKYTSLTWVVKSNGKSFDLLCGNSDILIDFPIILPDELTVREAEKILESMDDLDYECNRELARVEEERQRAEKKLVALNKLSKEEREILGLM